jgi:magnesium transporter
MAALGRFIPPDCQPLVADLEDQFARVAGVADGQVRYLEGVIEFYKARTDTKVTIAAERLALIAVLTLRWTPPNLGCLSRTTLGFRSPSG